MDMQPQEDMSDTEPMGGDFPQNDMNDMSEPMGNDMGNSEFDTDFDAGVDADEENDPKKYIQQLTGKLSQTLRKYNEDNGQPDVDLNKYVAGMITKQAMEGLSQDDADEILNKIKADEDFSTDEEQDMGNMEQNDGNQMPKDSGMEQQDNFQQPNESKIRNNRKLDEIIGTVLKQNDENHPYQQTDNKKSFRKKPFSSPNFENS